MDPWAPTHTCPAPCDACGPPPKTVKVGAGVMLQTYGGDILVGFHEETQSWGIPGGKVDYGEHPATTAVRECQEETGIFVADITPRTGPTWVTTAVYDNTTWVVLIYRVFVNTRPPAYEREPDKIHSWEWQPLLDLPKRRRPIGPLAAFYMHDQTHVGHLDITEDQANAT